MKTYPLLALLTFALLPTILSAEPVKLSSLDLTPWKPQPGAVAARSSTQIIATANQSPANYRLTIAGQSYLDGIGTIGGSVLFLQLDGGSDKFTANIGVDDAEPPTRGGGARGANAAPPRPASSVFRVLGDGKVLYESQPKQSGAAPENISVDTKGVKTLVLNVRSTGGGNQSPPRYVDWAEATLEVSGAKPVAAALPLDEPVILTPPASATPRINGPALTGVTAGHPVQYKIPATGTQPITYSADHLPDGLTLDAATGVISGVIKTKGVYTTTLHAKNSAGETSLDFKFDANGVMSLTPALGWNSWNCFAASISDEKVRQQADAMVAKGLINHGWTYVNIDDGWENRPTPRASDAGVFDGPIRDADGNIVPNVKFPDMKALADYVHSKGLKIGIYSSPGPTTCQGLAASWQHEDQDAALWAKWGFDYIKYDWCSYSTVVPGDRGANNPLPILKKPYQDMRAALNKVNRDFVFSLCQYGWGNVWEWGAEADVAGNSWRATGDITDTWQSMSNIGFAQTGHAQYAGPGHWNDTDMLVIGKVGWGPRLRDSNLTPNEQYVHISLWTILAAPMIIGCDMTQMDDFTTSLLSNDEVLAVHQDPAGHAGDRIAKNGLQEVWARTLADGSVAVGLFNRDEMPATVTAKWADLKISGSQTARDLWRQKDLGQFTDQFSAEVPRHGCLLLKLSPAK